MLQSSPGQKLTNIAMQYKDTCHWRLKVKRIASPPCLLITYHSGLATRDFQSAISVEALRWGYHLDVQGLLPTHAPLYSWLLHHPNGEVGCSGACVGEPPPEPLGGDHSAGPWQRTRADGWKWSRVLIFFSNCSLTVMLCIYKLNLSANSHFKLQTTLSDEIVKKLCALDLQLLWVAAVVAASVVAACLECSYHHKI